MQDHPSDTDVALRGCTALSTLARDDAKTLLIIGAGGIQVILKAMTAHAGHTGVNEYGCRAFENLARNSDANRVTIAAAGAILVIMKAMTSHAGHAGVNEFGCWAIANLAANAANQFTITAAGAIPVILKTMTAHAGHAGVNEQGCRALGRMVCSDPAIQQAAKVLPSPPFPTIPPSPDPLLLPPFPSTYDPTTHLRYMTPPYCPALLARP